MNAKKASINIRGIALSLLAAIFISVSSYAETIEVGVLHFPPFYDVKGDTEVDGYIPSQILHPVMALLGQDDYVIRAYPPKRLYENMANGKVHIWCGNKDVPTYNGKVFIDKDPVLHVDMRVYSIADTPQVKTREDLNGKRIIAIRGYSYGGFIRYLQNSENQITTDLTDTHHLAFMKLKKGRANYFLGFKNPSDEVLAEFPVENLKSNSIVKIPIFCMVSKAAPDARNLFDNFVEGLDQLERENKVSLGQ